MIIYILCLIDFIVFIVDLVIIWINWIASLNSSIIFFILYIKILIHFYLHLVGCFLRYVNIFYEDCV